MQQLFQPSVPVAAWLNAQSLDALALAVYKHTAEPSRQVPSVDQIVVRCPSCIPCCGRSCGDDGALPPPPAANSIACCSCWSSPRGSW